ncbi:Non-ribosomal peptide synthetase [Mycoavidus cysteinexigens]|uniref:Non-ribosomal peptide synthetase n=1 Tax=Mycoavidus cysteinexigens TaxID=1553431 RepID=A0A2Z6EWD8_9BURK|nr:hypothetical protein [Mycoavidus cysteinexigens]BBE09698.1 Non-ribosomal peptide synthetase [Mycoavidus cysteinexigens]GLR01676.1 hypothetical protein GCM10007934_14880 [Mycoavidus cysteinexigens]
MSKETPSGSGQENVIYLLDYIPQKLRKKRLTKGKAQSQLTLSASLPHTAQLVVKLYPDQTADSHIVGVHESNAINMLRVMVNAMSDVLDQIPLKKN